MRVIVATIATALTVSAVASAQPPASTMPASETKGFAEVVAQSAFGNVTSQSFGGEVGYTVRPNVQVFVDAGLVRDAAPTSLGTNALRIANGIAAVAGSADFHVKEPVTFGVVGVRLVVPTSYPNVLPYVEVGGGAAQVKRDVTFTTPSGDVTQFVTLGTDLSGSDTNGMLSLGAGVAVPIGKSFLVDVGYRYGVVFTSGDRLNINRAGIGVGVRF
ncbi:MAG TPA: outer membrane beta-barrel protein [Vicinamibacterales bacterium]|nr:outer membrane beta-barrel protein [Vicinamibacterales bacterium]